MVYDHMIKFNGKYYMPGENVPEEGEKVEKPAPSEEAKEMPKKKGRPASK